jgi:hypothetical protein
VVVVLLLVMMTMALYALRGGVSGLRIERITLWNLCFNSTGLGPWASGGGLAAITLAGYGCQVFCVRERDRRTGGRGQAMMVGEGFLSLNGSRTCFSTDLLDWSVFSIDGS